MTYNESQSDVEFQDMNYDMNATIFSDLNGRQTSSEKQRFSKKADGMRKLLNHMNHKMKQSNYGLLI